MMLSLHKNATTTPAIRAKIAASEEPVAVLAARSGVTLDTIYRWRGRTSFEDRSHTALQLATTLTRPQEAVVVELRRMLLLPLDDLLAVARVSQPRCVPLGSGSLLAPPWCEQSQCLAAQDARRTAQGVQDL
jgi:hypothetical protein